MNARLLPATLLALVVVLISAAFVWFSVDRSTYDLAEKSETLTIDSAEPLIAPNGKRPQDASNAAPDRTFDTVLPYFSAPHQ